MYHRTGLTLLLCLSLSACYAPRPPATPQATPPAAPVRLEPFQRANPSRPDGGAVVYYHNTAALNAALAAEGWHTRALPTDTLPLGQTGVTLSLLDEGGRPLPLYEARRTHVEGTAGQRFSLRLVNRSANRYEVLATVDGLDARSGQPGSYNHGGYLIEPGGQLTIAGFRQGEQSVLPFRFGRAGSAGASPNVGVIGVALFGESRILPPPPPAPAAPPREPNPFPGNDPRYAPPPRS
ncbi:MAG TPA: hypothetical protein VNN09_00570 [Candidatus Competibacteraceae bacterium]|nr:hypothetical protein [Candidatus Competibacteraceae bacterium]